MKSKLRCRTDGCGLGDRHEAAAAAGQQTALSVMNFRYPKTIATLFFLLPACDGDFRIDGHWSQILDVQLGSYRAFFGQLGNFAHRFIEQNCNDAAVGEPSASGIA